MVIEDTGLSVYIIIFDVHNKVWNNNINGFEPPVAANWSHYAILLVDSTGTGLYYGNFPTGITGVGDYTVVSYIADTPGTPAVGDSFIPGGEGIMHWDGSAEIEVASMGPADIVSELYGSHVVNTTTFQKIMQGLAAINLGDLTEDNTHGTSGFTDVNDPDTVRVTSTNTQTSRSVILN